MSEEQSVNIKVKDKGGKYFCLRGESPLTPNIAHLVLFYRYSIAMGKLHQI